MGDLTRANMESLVKLRIGGRTDLDTTITTAITTAYDSLVSSMLFPENQETAVMVTVTGTSSYAGPTDLFYPVSLRNLTTGKPLFQLQPKQYDEILTPSRQDDITHYLWWKNYFTFYPTPGTNPNQVQLRYHRRLAALSTSGSYSALPRDWDEVIVQGGLYRILSWTNQPDDSMKEEMRYKTMVKDRVDRLGLGRIDTLAGAAPQLGDFTAWRQR